MRHLKKPKFDVKKIVEECASSFRDKKTRDKFNSNSDYIAKKSDEYDKLAQNCDWACIIRESKVNGEIETQEMVSLYEDKFAKHKPEREKYYDNIMSLATNGKCPICGVGSVSNLDHYLAKSIYPTYAVTPINLLPICRDCNFTKRSECKIDPIVAPFHPYYDTIDDIIWLKADIDICSGELNVSYYIDPLIQSYDIALYNRLISHFELYGLSKVFSIQAATEIAENISFWKKKYIEWGESSFVEYIKECLQSKEIYQLNTWNTALLRSIIDNIGIFSELTNEIMVEM